MFASVSSGCYICLQWFLNVFRRFCKCLKHLFQLFYLSFFLYVITIASIGRCLGLRGRHPERRRPTAGALTLEPDALGARSLCEQGANASTQIGRPDASKSDIIPSVAPVS
jgi:hypothetical protein